MQHIDNEIRDVFIAGGEPTITYVHREANNNKLEDKISSELYSSKVIIIHGASKLGKTVVTKRIFNDTNHIWIDGGVAKNALSIWKQILLNSDMMNKTNYYQLNTTEEDAKLIVNMILQKYKTPLIIDDFHLIEISEQKKMVQFIKSLVFNKIPIIFICVPHRIVDIVNAEREMNSRYIDIEISPWSKKELSKIAEEGFLKLNYEYQLDMVEDFIKNSFGSPFIMQELCYNSAILIEKYKKRNNTIINPLKELGPKLFYGQLAESYYTDEFNWVLNGTKSYATSQKRVNVIKNNGIEIDMFQAVTEAIAICNIEEPINYTDIKLSLKSFLIEEPDSSRITHVLNKMNTLAIAIIEQLETPRDPILEWNNESKILYILDPFLKFYIKWIGKYS